MKKIMNINIDIYRDKGITTKHREELLLLIEEWSESKDAYLLAIDHTLFTQQDYQASQATDEEEYVYSDEEDVVIDELYDEDVTGDEYD